MNGRLRIPTALVAIAALGLTIATVAGCGPGGAAASAMTGTSTPMPASTAAPTASPAASGPHKLTSGSLPAGDYTTTVFKPTLHFALAEGWNGNFPDDADGVALNRGDDRSILGMSQVARIVDPVTHKAVPVPADLVGWLGAHPSFEWAGPSMPVEIGGLSGSTLKGQLKDGMPQTEIFAYDTGNFRAVPKNPMQFYVLALDGGNLTIVVMAADSYFAEFSAASQPVLDSLEIVRP
jgi:hypothetical protein